MLVRTLPACEMLGQVPSIMQLEAAMCCWPPLPVLLQRVCMRVAVRASAAVRVRVRVRLGARVRVRPRLAVRVIVRVRVRVRE